MAYFLGVDGGGTKTEFVLADESRELGRVRTGSIKRLRQDAETAERRLREALDELAAKTGVSMQSVTGCCVGAAGESVPTVVEWTTNAFRRLVGGELLLAGDVEIALDAVFHGGRGVLALAGTGSQIAGRGSRGSILTAGGWGPAISDEGSGGFLGTEALRRGFRAIDEERPTVLLDAIRRHWGLASLAELIEFVNQNPSPEFSQLAPLVVECADQGDEIAAETIRQGASDLAYLATLVIERIRRVEAGESGEFTVPAVALAGSILGKVALARETLESALRSRYPKIAFIEEPADPVQGALWRARRGS